MHNFLTNLNFNAKIYQNTHLNVLNNFFIKGMAKICLQEVQEGKGQIEVELHSAQAAERRTLQGLNLIKNIAKSRFRYLKVCSLIVES